MNYRKAVREALRFFPSELIVVEGVHSPDGIARSSNLAAAWEQAEVQTKNWSVWHQLAVWAVGCALQRLIREEGAKGFQFVLKEMLDYKYAEYKFAESLLTPNSWFPRHIKRAYRRDRFLRGLPRFAEGRAKNEQ